MTPLVLPHPPFGPLSLDWMHALLRACAGLPERLEDWQLRDLNLTRPYPGPGHPTTPWIP